ncbi:hypothetical protein NKH18_17540 [Streptomyces sp. M10(2022)]
MTATDAKGRSASSTSPTRGSGSSDATTAPASGRSTSRNWPASTWQAGCRSTT